MRLVRALSFALALVACGCGERELARVRIATGQQGGTFLPLGETLAAAFAEDLHGPAFEAIESPGSVASVAMLSDGATELALVSNHVAGASDIQLVAPLYQETLQVVVRRGAGIGSPLELAGRKVSVGPAGSGTEAIADAVLGHFALDAAAYDRRNLSLVDASAALIAGEIDAAFVVAGMRTPAVDELLGRGDMDLLSLGAPGQVGSALEGIRLDAPFFTVTTVPERAYGRLPAAPIGTISVHALLVARADLDEDLVHDVTESLYAHKVELAKQERLLSHLSERYDPALSPYPVHPGADRYYRRDEPSLLQRYVDEISLAITLAAILWSALTALRAARHQRQRSRIESHYAEVREIVARRAELGPDEVRGRLVAAREKALAELVDERLEANSGYLILQDYIGTQIAELDRARLTSP